MIRRLIFASASLFIADCASCRRWRSALFFCASSMRPQCTGPRFGPQLNYRFVQTSVRLLFSSLAAGRRLFLFSFAFGGLVRRQVSGWCTACVRRKKGPAGQLLPAPEKRTPPPPPPPPRQIGVFLLLSAVPRRPGVRTSPAGMTGVGSGDLGVRADRPWTLAGKRVPPKMCVLSLSRPYVRAGPLAVRIPNFWQLYAPFREFRPCAPLVPLSNGRFIIWLYPGRGRVGTSFYVWTWGSQRSVSTVLIVFRRCCFLQHVPQRRLFPLRIHPETFRIISLHLLKIVLLLLPTVYRHIACFSSHPCLCLILWTAVASSFSRSSSAPSSYQWFVPCYFHNHSINTLAPFFLSLQHPVI